MSQTSKQSTNSSQHPNWVFTANYGLPTQPTRDEFLDNTWLAICDKAHYAICGDETAPTTGQTHFQGYVQFLVKQRLGSLKRLPHGQQIHWEPARGDERANIEYCSKSGSTRVHGDEPRVVNGGKREKLRWDKILQDAKSGNFDAIDPKVQVIHHSSLMKIHAKYRTCPGVIDHTTKMLWVWGPTGTGKSRFARSYFEDRRMEWHYKTTDKWWCGYEGQRGVLIEDIDMQLGKDLAYYLKLWLDIYPFRGEYKGGSMMLRPELIIMTSNYHPFQLWGEREREWFDPIMRRLTLVPMFKEGDVVPDYGPPQVTPTQPPEGQLAPKKPPPVKKLKRGMSGGAAAAAGSNWLTPDDRRPIKHVIDLTKDTDESDSENESTTQEMSE